MELRFEVTEERYDEMWEDGTFYFEEEEGELFLCNEEWGESFKGENEEDCIKNMLDRVDFLASEEEQKDYEDTMKDLKMWYESQI